jgi:hypothetical protein
VKTKTIFKFAVITLILGVVLTLATCEDVQDMLKDYMEQYQENNRAEDFSDEDNF